MCHLYHFLSFFSFSPLLYYASIIGLWVCLHCSSKTNKKKQTYILLFFYYFNLKSDGMSKIEHLYCGCVWPNESMTHIRSVWHSESFVFGIYFVTPQQWSILWRRPRVILEASPVPARKAQNKLQCLTMERYKETGYTETIKCYFLTSEIKEQYLNVPFSNKKFLKQKAVIHSMWLL